MKFLFALLILSSGTVALAAPKNQAKFAERKKAVAFLDGIAAKHRALRSVSATWERTHYNPSSGTFDVLRTTPPKLRYTDDGMRASVVSDGVRRHETGTYEDGITRDYVWTPQRSAVPGEVDEIACDEVTRIVLSGRNPLRVSPWGSSNGQSQFGEARLLPAGLVRGVRCRGVEWKYIIEGVTGPRYIDTYSMWFDSRGLIRRTSQATSGVVDFEMRPNVKLSPDLFKMPRPNDKKQGKVTEVSIH